MQFDRRIVARGLTRRFGDKLAVEGVDLDLGPGGIVGLLGPNGSGKSTLLRMLVGLVPPDAGSVQVDGVALSGDGTAVRRRCTYAPGEIALYDEMKGAEHLGWFLRGRGAAALARGLALAAELDLPMQKRVRTYSHGMKRQLLFIAALAPETGVRILDEPTEGLDPSKRSHMLSLLEQDAARGTTVLLSSHHLGEVDRSCDQLLFLNAGRVLSRESAETVHAREARILVVDWGAAELAPTLERALGGLGAEAVHVDGGRAVVHLAAPDPRPFLAALAGVAELPAPSSIEYGRASLGELYRDVYGVEGT